MVSDIWILDVHVACILVTLDTLNLSGLRNLSTDLACIGVTLKGKHLLLNGLSKLNLACTTLLSRFQEKFYLAVWTFSSDNTSPFWILDYII